MEIVSVAVPAVVPVILTGLVEPKLNVGRSWAPVGVEVTAAVITTLPVNPPEGVTVIVEVFPVVAPGKTVTAVPLTMKVIVWDDCVAVPLSETLCELPLLFRLLSFSTRLPEYDPADAGIKSTL